MDQRAEKILEKIILHYIKNAEPVGSRVLSKLIDEKLSPATIRNVMADLTELGYIEQPHTSAGRIPTDSGYRYYINKLISDFSDSIGEAATGLEELIQDEELHPSRLEDILLKVTRELSSMTNCTGLVISPKLSASRLKQIQFVRLTEKQILVVIITQIGMVHNKVIHVRTSPSQDDLDKMARILIDLFEKEQFVKIRSSLINELTKKQDEHNELIIQAIRLGKKAFEIEKSGELYISGRSKMCLFPEFSDQDKLRAVYSAFEEKSVLTEIMIQAMENEGIKVNIGAENRLLGLNTCSVVAGTYGNKGYTLGSIGIVGPTRLDYPQVISAINYSTWKLSVSLDHFLDKT